MDLDDLAELEGPSKANTRTTRFAPKSSKFAPKLKPNSKPKPQSSSKQEPQDSSAKPEPPPAPSQPQPFSKKKENEVEDLKPPVVAEPKAEQLLSNGAVKMEIEEEAKEDEIMNEENRDEKQEEEDMVVREIDVFLTHSTDANTQLYVLQYPLRAQWRPYELDERCEKVRVKPASGEVEIDMSIDVDSNNFDSERASKLKMTKQPLLSLPTSIDIAVAEDI